MDRCTVIEEFADMDYAAIETDLLDRVEPSTFDSRQSVLQANQAPHWRLWKSNYFASLMFTLA